MQGKARHIFNSYVQKMADIDVKMGYNPDFLQKNEAHTAFYYFLFSENVTRAALI